MKLNRKIKLLISVLLGISFSLLAQTDVSTAQKQYENGNYAEAAKAYEKVLKEGFLSPELYYNYANTQYKLGKLGKAIYYYELAAKWKPGDEYIQHNLTLAGNKVVDKIAPKQNYFLTNLKQSIVFFFDLSTWTIFFFCFLFLFGLCALAWWFYFSVSIRKVLLILGFFALFGTVSSFVCALSYRLQLESISKAVVLDPEVQVFTSPTTKVTPHFSLHEGTRVKVIETNANWTCIQLDNGNEGWIQTPRLGLY